MSEPVSQYSCAVRGQHYLRVWNVCRIRCGVLMQPSLSTHTTHSHCCSLSWVNTSEETVKLWLLSRGNALTSQLCTNNVAPRKARWLTAFSTQCGEGFHLFHHSKFMLFKLIMDHLSLTLCSTGDIRATKPHWSTWCFATLWHFTSSQSGVFCRWPCSQTAESICQLKTTGVLGAAGLQLAERQSRHEMRNEHGIIRNYSYYWTCSGWTGTEIPGKTWLWSQKGHRMPSKQL